MDSALTNSIGSIFAWAGPGHFWSDGRNDH